MPVWLGVLLVLAGLVLIFIGAALVVRTEIGATTLTASANLWDVLKEIITEAGAGGVLMIFGAGLVFVGAAGLGVEFGWFDGSQSTGGEAP